MSRGRYLTHLSSSPSRVLSSIDVTKLNVIDSYDNDPTSIELKTTPTTADKPCTQIAYEGSTSTSDDPTANLTFNLSLSDKEKTARERVVLPFSKKRPGHGKIIYEAEDEDDFDEEDPDDDLNI